jgi:hypothetical protein
MRVAKKAVSYWSLALVAQVAVALQLVAMVATIETA